MGQGTKFFEMSYADINRENISKESSHDGDVDFMLNRNELFKWLSVGAASDSTSVIIEITFDNERVFDSFIFSGCNLKDFSVDKYDDGGASWVNLFTETSNTNSFFYYKTISETTATKIRIVMNKTLVADQEKYIKEFIVTKEIGQITYRPGIVVGTNQNLQEKKMIDGISKFLLNRRQKSYTIDYRSYTHIGDRALLKLLEKKYTPFLIWACGGNITQFSYPDDGYALEDIYLVALTNNLSRNYTKNYYKAGTNVIHTFTQTT